MWFTLNQANAIGRIGMDGARHGSTRCRPRRPPRSGIAAGPTGRCGSSRSPPGRSGGSLPTARITEFPLPDRTARPHAITAARDGTSWFTEWGGNRVGSITPDGTVTVHDLPTPASEPHGITLGPDGALWTALEIGALARIGPSIPNHHHRSTPNEERS